MCGCVCGQCFCVPLCSNCNPPSPLFLSFPSAHQVRNSLPMECQLNPGCLHFTGLSSLPAPFGLKLFRMLLYPAFACIAPTRRVILALIRTIPLLCMRRGPSQQGMQWRGGRCGFAILFLTLQILRCLIDESLKRSPYEFIFE